MRVKPTIQFSLIALVAVAAASCGSSSKTSSISTAGGASSSQSTQAQPAPGGTSQAPSEAQSAATGDIPDNQVFLTYRNPAGGYSIKYPEGWARKGSGAAVSFQDKANLIRITVDRGAAPTTANSTASLSGLKRTDPTIKVGKAQQITLAGAPVVKLTYTRLSAPDPVTGKRLPLTIDRYEYAHSGRVAVVDLGTPVGVDNVDAYRMISESFRWK